MTDTQLRLAWHDRAIRTPTHSHDPQPAAEAGEVAAGRATERAAVLSAINAWPMTQEELDFVFPNWPARNGAKRCSDLHTAAHGSLVISTGTTRPTRSGRQATVWTTTAEGARLADKWAGIPPQQLVASAHNRARAGLDPASRWECPYDGHQYATKAGLIQHQRRTCKYVKVIR